MHAAEKAFGPVSVLVNNAEITGWQDQARRPSGLAAARSTSTSPASISASGGGSLDAQGWRRLNREHLLDGGFSAAAGAFACSASHWGVRGLTKAAALELGCDDIRVNSVHAALTHIPMADERAGGVARSKAMPVDTCSIPRVVRPEGVTRLVLFLASGDASFSTGSEFLVDGGLLLGSALARGPHRELTRSDRIGRAMRGKSVANGG